MLPKVDSHNSLDVAVRRNKGLRMAVEFREKAARLLGRPTDTIRLTSVEDFDALQTVFATARARATAGNRPESVTLATASRKELEAHLAAIRRVFPDLEMLLLREGSQYCGALHVRSSEVFSHFLDLVEMNGEDLLACAQDGRAGVFCAWWQEPNDPAGQEIYAFQAWFWGA